MTRTVLTLSLLLAATAAAQPKPQPKPTSTTVSAPASYESCSTSWAHACNKRDANGNTYGTAHQMTRCERYTLLPDGTFTSTYTRGTYKIVKNTVKFSAPQQDGSVYRSELVLAPDGSTLGGMKRL